MTRAQLLETTNVLADADADVVEHAHDVLATLAPLDPCGDVDGLQHEVDPPRADQAKAVERGQNTSPESRPSSKPADTLDPRTR